MGSPAGHANALARFFAPASAGAQQFSAALARAASANAHVVLRCERGNGAECVARELHRASRRAGNAFAAVRASELDAAACADLRERARDGTIFIEHAEALAPAAQASLASWLTGRDVTTRVIASSEHDLAQRVEKRDFRADLFYSLNGASLRLAPLRERAEDIPVLARAILAHLSSGLALSSAAERALASHSWPGNVRELELTVERAALIATGERIEARDLALGQRAPAAPATSAEPVISLQELELAAIQSALTQCGGNKLRAARMLGIHRATLHHKLRDLRARRAS